jgi:hypothetical protein
MSDIERGILATGPEIASEVWEASRIVNFHTGLARLTFKARMSGALEPRGTVQLQQFRLADGQVCLKVHLSWPGTEATKTLAIYSVPDLNWKAEGNRVAEGWLDGPPAGSSIADSMAATG